MSRYLVVPAAGSGERLGNSLPKALVAVAGRPLICRALDPFSGIPFDGGVILSPPGREEEVAEASGHRFPVLAGGRSRAESVAAGFAALAPRPEDIVVIHDAARPFVVQKEIEAVICRAEEVGAAIAVVALPDTLKRVDNGRIVATVDRSEVVAAATPQVFRAGLLRRAIQEAPPGTDEAARCEALGIPVAAVRVSRKVFKITYPEDLELARLLAKDAS